MKLWTPFFILAICVSGCNSTVAAEDYDQTCKTASDCTVVFVGDLCDCGCNYAAIAQSAMASYQADEADARGSCFGSMQCEPCAPPPPPVCTAGKCTFQQ